MPSPRWRKVLRDLWGSKTRTLLVTLSIAIGVFAVGVVTQTLTMVQNRLTAEYRNANPASASFATDFFDDDLLQTVRRMPGVDKAEGRTAVSAKVEVGPDQWKPMLLFAISDFNHIDLQRVYPQETFPSKPALNAELGEWPPPKRGVLIERGSFAVPGILPPETKVGSAILIEASDGRRFSLRVAGLARDPVNAPPAFGGAAFGYITLDTLEWLTGTRQQDMLYITVAEDKYDKAHITSVADAVRNKIENGGLTVHSMVVSDPNKHPLQDLLQGLMLLLNVLGICALVLSGFLIVNTISAHLSQQVRQIGMMKAIGARQGQIAAMYLVMVLIYGVLALVIAVPLSALVSSGAAALLSAFLNADPPSFTFMPDVIVTQVLIALIFPILAGILPVLRGSRLTVREAITDYGISGAGQSKSQVSRNKDEGRRMKDETKPNTRSFSSFILHPSSFPSRPLLLSLRNTFRRKGRLALTLTTLVLAGAIFIGVFSVRTAMLLTLDDALKYWNFDILMPLSRPYLTDVITQEVMQVPGVVGVEAWGLGNARRLRSNDTESDNITVFAPPAQTHMLEPTIIQGRWLLPEDENALVISNSVTAVEKDIRVGDTITLKINGKKSNWHVVGLARVVGQFGQGIGTVYINQPYYARVVGQVNRATSIQVVTDKHDSAYEDQIKKAIEQKLDTAGIHFGGGVTTGQIREQNEMVFNVLVVMLLFMAVLMALVGGLGLMGTMTLNVLERTREIGVMRAVGASDGAIRQIVLVEGFLIGLLSCLFGAAAAIPFGGLLSEALGSVIFQMPLHYEVSTGGMVIWGFVVVVISTLASLLPAYNASRLTVRQVLAYE